MKFNVTVRKKKTSKSKGMTTIHSLPFQQFQHTWEKKEGRM